MKISDIKILLTNKLATLELQKLNALAIWDMVSFDRVWTEIEETTQTINEIL